MNDNAMSPAPKANSDTPTQTSYIESRARLLDRLRAVTSGATSDATSNTEISWLEGEQRRITEGLPQGETSAQASWLTSELGELLIEVRRRFSRRHLITSFAARESAHLESALGAQPIGHWRRDETAKLWLIATVICEGFDIDQRYEALYQVYDAADTEGRVVCLRALNFVEGLPEAGLTIIHDAGRTYLKELMEAAWCNSPFATRYLSTEEYRKAVLKALFCDVPVGGFMGLEDRADAELSRRLCEYANEREAAGRVVHPSVLRVASFYPQPGLISRLIGRLEHPSAEERLTAAVGLARAADTRALSFIEERVAREDEPEVLAALQEALAQLSASVPAHTSGEAR